MGFFCCDFFPVGFFGGCFFFLGVGFLLAQHFTLPPGLLRVDICGAINTTDWVDTCFGVMCSGDLYYEVLCGGLLYEGIHSGASGAFTTLRLSIT